MAQAARIEIYVKPSGVGSAGRFSFDNVVCLTYNILNKTTGVDR